MNDQAKTKKQIIKELIEMRRRLSELEAEKTESRHSEAHLLARGKKQDFVLEGADLGFWDWDLTNGKALWAEQTFRMLGYEPNEVQPDLKNWKRLIHPDDWPKVSERLNLHIKGKLPMFEVDYRIRNKSGDWQWVQGRGKVIEFGADGKPVRLMGVLVDATERKRAEESLRESEQRYRSLFEGSRDAIYLTARDGKLVEANQSFLDLFGFTRQEARDLNILTVYRDPTDRKRFQARIERHGSLKDYEVKFQKKDGTKIDCLLSSALRLDKEGTILGYQAIARDITHRKMVEQSLRESEEKYRSVVENMQDVFYRSDLNGNIVLVSPSGPAMIGYESVDEIIGLNVGKDFYKNPEERDRLLAAIRKKGKVSNYEVELLKKDGSSIVVSTNSHLYYDKSGKLLGVEGVFTDITAREQAEDALRKSEARYRTLVEYANEGIFVAQDAVLKSPNSRLARMTGYDREELSGKPFARFIHPEDVDMVLHRHKQRVARVPGLPSSYPFRIICKDGDILWVELNTAMIEWEGRPATLNMLRDISERKMAEDAFLQAERLKAIADLAGGVAHNFNNLLQVVMGGIGLALIDLEMGNMSALRKTLMQVLETSKFGAETVRRLQSFAEVRADLRPSEKKIFDLSETVKQSVEMTKPWWKTLPEKEGLTVDLRLSLSDGCLVKGSESEMFEVLVNLVKNAAEALPKGGEIRIETSTQNDQVVLQVADTGMGIGAENLKKVFQPFWSTKGVAAGTGMGLAVSHGIISRNGGTITVQSEEGKGSIFTIRFPLAERPQEVGAPQGEELFHLRLKFLVVDDTEPIATLLGSILTKHAQTVFSAASGEEALEIFRNSAIDVVICDLGMPGMNGWDVGKAIRTICRERGIAKTPFILLTGWGGQTLEEEKIVDSGVDAVLEKPLDNEKLMATIKEIVDTSLHSER